MYRVLVSLFIIMLAIFSCKKPISSSNNEQSYIEDTSTAQVDSGERSNPSKAGELAENTNNESNFLTDIFNSNGDKYDVYIIKKGNNYCEDNSYPFGIFKTIKFRAVFDSSGIYENVDPVNQGDINKLFGIADCASHHQKNSARFGWSWQGNKMNIHAYCYADGVRSYKKLGSVDIGEVFTCELALSDDKYIFTFNGKTESMDRGCNSSVATGYKLLPYFGGDEPAPQDITIRIEEL